ncbi:DNA-deoxyinosine glycosylase [Flavobacterium qiangtangense]|uniref:DNA-deoxyinosine glycosylase n=1 Tax=Flavobacterium qiangtangense TaxID=1442595 RepID=A0ABW1PIG6_9FLAO
MEPNSRIETLDPLAGPDSRVLILGTAPGALAMQSGEYFAHPRNQFWRLLFAVFETSSAVSYQEKMKFLQARGIALWEVLESCERIGSSDSAIRNERPNDVPRFLAQHPRIRHVFFDSRAAKKFYQKYHPLLDTIEYGLLPSPSPAYASMTFEQKLEKWKAVRLAADSLPQLQAGR